MINHFNPFCLWYALDFTDQISSLLVCLLPLWVSDIPNLSLGNKYLSKHWWSQDLNLYRLLWPIFLIKAYPGSPFQTSANSQYIKYAQIPVILHLSIHISANLITSKMSASTTTKVVGLNFQSNCCQEISDHLAYLCYFKILWGRNQIVILKKSKRIFNFHTFFFLQLTVLVALNCKHANELTSHVCQVKCTMISKNHMMCTIQDGNNSFV